VRDDQRQHELRRDPEGHVRPLTAFVEEGAVMAAVGKKSWEHPKGSGNWKWAWCVNYKVDGKWKCKVAKPNKRHVADKLKEEIERNIADGRQLVRHGTETHREVAEAWFKDKQEKKLAPGTLGNYRRHLDLRILPLLGSIKQVDLTSERIERWVKEIRKDKYSHVGAYWVLDNILKYAAKKKIAPNPLVRDPFDPPAREDPDIVILTRQELRALLEAAITPLHKQGVREYAQVFKAVIIMLAVLCGLRKGEVAGLQWENILNARMDALDDEIRIRHSQSKYGLGPPKTKAGKREVPMPAVLRPWLEWIWEQEGRRRTGYVFAAAGACFYNNIWHCYFVPVMKQAGLEGNGKHTKASFHSLRHVAGSLWLAQGVDIVEVSRMMGHSDPAFTYKVYIKELRDRSKGPGAIAAISQDLMPEPKLLPSPSAPKLMLVPDAPKLMLVATDVDAKNPLSSKIRPKNRKALK
jgi:integrase